MDPAPHVLPDLLRRARSDVGLSQLALSFRLGVSQRHISFVENGRAQPSRALLHAWLEELNVPLTERNVALDAAGYAPIYTASQLGDATLAIAQAALRQLLSVHDPMPAWVLDAHWNVLQANHGAQWLMTSLVPSAMHAETSRPLNLVDLLVSADGLLCHIVNLREVGPTMLAHLRADARAHAALAPKADALSEALRVRLGDTPTSRGAARSPLPLIPTRFATQDGVLSFFPMLTTFGTPQDITLASLRVEHMFAADAHTASVLATRVPPRAT